jgi:hypothetical protein
MGSQDVPLRVTEDERALEEAAASAQVNDWVTAGAEHGRTSSTARVTARRSRRALPGAARFA